MRKHALFILSAAFILQYVGHTFRYSHLLIVVLGSPRTASSIVFYIIQWISILSLSMINNIKSR